MAQGHIPIEEVVIIARQIAAALEAGHEKSSTAEAIRLEVATGRRDTIARLDFKQFKNGSDSQGWTEDGEPLAIRDLSSAQVYRIDPGAMRPKRPGQVWHF